jgi:hypothetical protein
VFLSGQCYDVISKGQSQILGSSALELVKRGPERFQLKNLYC